MRECLPSNSIILRVYSCKSFRSSSHKFQYHNFSYNLLFFPTFRQITELILDNCRSTNIDGLTDSFKALEVLSLINVGLVSLKNFPKLPALRKLELSDNRIQNALSHLTGSPKLTHLNLSGNRIKDFEELQPLKELENLEVLDLFNNEVTMTQNYRDKIFELIPSLKYLDG